MAADGISTTPVSGTGAATFADKNVGTLKTVTINGFTAPTANYTVVPPTVKASITAAPVTVTGATATNRQYDGLTTVAVSGGTAVGLMTADVDGGTVSLNTAGATGTMASANAGSKGVTVSGYALAGADATNYKLTQPTGVTVVIARKELTITGLTANNKTYDGTTTATASGTATLVGVVAGQTVTLGGTPVYRFADASVGTGKTVTTTGYTISATSPALASNYILIQPTLSANITQAKLTVTATSYTIKVNANIPTLTYTITGLKPGDTPTNTYEGTPSLTTNPPAERGSPVGVYTVVISEGTLTLLTGTGKKGGNYFFEFVNGTITITP